MQDAWEQLDGIEDRTGPGVGQFALRGTVHVVKGRGGCPALGDGAQVPHIGGFGQTCRTAVQVDGFELHQRAKFGDLRKSTLHGYIRLSVMEMIFMVLQMQVARVVNTAEISGGGMIFPVSCVDPYCGNQRALPAEVQAPSRIHASFRTRQLSVMARAAMNPTPNATQIHPTAETPECSKRVITKSIGR